MRLFFLKLIGLCYRRLIKPLLFLCNPELVHTQAVTLGELLGKFKPAQKILSFFFAEKNPTLHQQLFNLSFHSPVGLAAGFDYEARLTQILPSLGFGFGTIGTITNEPYEGNPSPMLGRLPASKSLLVNKGFKNLGIDETLRAVQNLTFTLPIGLSIGKTNTGRITTQAEGVADIISALQKAEHSPAPFSYYELNISCPNLKGSVEFYEPIHLEELLTALRAENLKKPVWIKMPISKTDAEIESILEVITHFPFIKAVVIGNLQRDRSHASLKSHEVEHCGKGNFSGLACRERSNELIALTYKKYGHKLKVIGCGGIFSAEDAYKKITLGASLVQLITGMIYEGPQLIAQINQELPKLLAQDGFKNVSEAVGSKNKNLYI